jgi:phosphomannomutase
LSTKTIDPGIFKAYDIRGLYGEQIDAEVAYRIARALIAVLAFEEGLAVCLLRFVVVREMGLSSAELSLG